MDLLMIVLTIAIVGCVVWAIETYIPMSPPFHVVIRVVVVVVLILYVLRWLGVALPNFR